MYVIVLQSLDRLITSSSNNVGFFMIKTNWAYSQNKMEPVQV